MKVKINDAVTVVALKGSEVEVTPEQYEYIKDHCTVTGEKPAPKGGKKTR